MMTKLFPASMGMSEVRETEGEYLLRLPEYTGDNSIYSNAQISSYQSRSDLEYEAPLKMQLSAKFEGVPQGTAGFGFWNQPFMSGQWNIRPPRAVWFFYGSEKNNIHLAYDVPGSGWKAGTIDAYRWQFWALLPTAPIGFILMRFPALYRLLWPVGQAALGVSEYLINQEMMSDWHEYTILWKSETVNFFIDGQLIHHSPYSPRGKVGFIAWIDNQYAIVTPQGHFGGGLVSNLHDQQLRLHDLEISSDL